MSSRVDVEKLVDEAIDAYRELADHAGEDMPRVDRHAVRKAVEENLASGGGSEDNSARTDNSAGAGTGGFLSWVMSAVGLRK